MLQIALEKWNFEIVECDEGTEALRILKADDGPQLAVLDWMMPGLSGPDICKAVREASSERYCYILLLTARNNENDIIEGMESGADDYVVKPFNVHELEVRLRAGARIIELQNQLIATREVLRLKAAHDFLTGLWNRAAIIDILTRECGRSAREHRALGVIMGDLDHFKDINDTYGHPAGDHVLCEVAQRLLRGVRIYDAVGRYGGEEFLMVVPGLDSEGTAHVAERIHQIVTESFVEAPDAVIPVTISLGVASCDSGKTPEPGALISHSDKALYQAKHEGRNRVVVYQ
jgi:diguanylate cyclase (GGDEF)-like protein